MHCRGVGQSFLLLYFGFFAVYISFDQVLRHCDEEDLGQEDSSRPYGILPHLKDLSFLISSDKSCSRFFVEKHWKWRSFVFFPPIWAIHSPICKADGFQSAFIRLHSFDIEEDLHDSIEGNIIFVKICGIWSLLVICRHGSSSGREGSKFMYFIIINDIFR